MGSDQLCDRKKPSCTSCLTGGKDCVYADRKPRVTAGELEEQLRGLERKYADCLKAAKFSAKTYKGSAKSINEASPLTPATSVATNADGWKRCDNRKSSPPPHSDPPFGGYHFDETFLAIPSFTMGTTFRPLETSFGNSHLITPTTIIPYPTRIFTPVLRITPKGESGLPSGSLRNVDLSYLEEEKPEVRTAKRRRLTSPFGHSLNQSKPKDIALEATKNTVFDAFHRPRQLSLAPLSFNIIQAPSLHFFRATWWDHLLRTYAAGLNVTSTAVSSHSATADISRDLYLFFKAAPLWLCFFNVPLFYDGFCHPERRANIQPALVLSVLSYAKLLQSDGDASRGETLEERERVWTQSVLLRDLAQASFEASYNAGWIDLQLAKAAWASASLLDNVIRYLGLVSIDAMDSRAPSYAAGAAPALGRPLPNGVIIKDDGLQPRESATATESIAPALPSPLRPLRSQAAVAGTLFNIWGHAIVEPPLHLDNVGRSGIPTGCPCEALSFSRTPDLLRSTPSWRFMPKWGQNGSVGEIEKEEARRLVWSTVIILGSDANARRAAGFPRLDLHISKPENFAILFPGEDDYSSLPDVDRVYSGKE
ncbi:hypothetical protein FRB98_001884 [Tulasnella sp. 332]|nr:hypothetical protein FRB98_001884 [Tulasnella sp. 332]